MILLHQSFQVKASDDFSAVSTKTVEETANKIEKPATATKAFDRETTNEKAPVVKSRKKPVPMNIDDDDDDDEEEETTVMLSSEFGSSKGEDSKDATKKEVDTVESEADIEDLSMAIKSKKSSKKKKKSKKK